VDKAKRRLYWAVVIFILTFASVVLLRTLGCVPSPVASALGVAAIYLMGAAVFFGIHLNNLKRLLRAARTPSEMEYRP